MVDIGDDASVAALAAKIEAKHGRCEILVNNAAISDGSGIEKLSMRRYHEVIRVNQDGAIRLWSETPYKFIKRQSQANSGQWVDMIDDRVLVVAAAD